MADWDTWAAAKVGPNPRLLRSVRISWPEVSCKCGGCFCCFLARLLCVLKVFHLGTVAASFYYSWHMTRPPQTHTPTYIQPGIRPCWAINFCFIAETRNDSCLPKPSGLRRSTCPKDEGFASTSFCCFFFFPPFLSCSGFSGHVKGQKGDECN